MTLQTDIELVASKLIGIDDKSSEWFHKIFLDMIARRMFVPYKDLNHAEICERKIKQDKHLIDHYEAVLADVLRLHYGEEIKQIDFITAPVEYRWNAIVRVVRERL